MNVLIAMIPQTITRRASQGRTLRSKRRMSRTRPASFFIYSAIIFSAKQVMTSIDELTAMLLGTSSSASAKKMLHSQKGIENNQTAKYIYTSISRILDEIGSDDVMDIYTPDKKGRYKVDAWLDRSGFALTTVNKYYNAINSVSNPDNATAALARKIDPAARTHFLDIANRNNDVIKSRMNDNVANKRELDNILPWTDIMRCYRSKRDSLDPQQRLLVDMYVGFADEPAGAPRRLDYGKLRVYTKKPGKNGSQNYIVVDKSGGVFMHLSEFKTANRRKEPIEVDLPRGLCDRITESLGDKPWRTYLFCKLRGGRGGCEHLSAQRLGDQLSKAMESMTGKSIPVSGIRKSFITWLHSRNLSNNRLKEFAYQMGHDVVTATLYRKLNIDDSKKVSGGGGEGPQSRCFRCKGTGHWAADCPLR